MSFNHSLTLVSSLVLVAVVVLLITRGWKSRARRQSNMAPLPEIPQELDGATADFACDVQYVCTTTAGDWLDRIAAHGLGMKSNGQALVYPSGLIVTRNGAQDLWIARDRVDSLRRESGMAGKFVEKEGLAVVTWRLGDDLVDTGLRTRAAADTPELIDRLRSIAPQAESGLPDQKTPQGLGPDQESSDSSVDHKRK